MKMKEVIEKKGKLLELLREAVTAKDYDQDKVDAINKDINECDHQKKSIEDMNARIADQPPVEDEVKENFRSKLDSFLRTGAQGIAGEGGRVFDLGIHKDSPEARAYDWNKTTGAYLFPDEIGSFVQEAKTYVGGMVTPGLCTTLRTSTGRKISIPTVDDTSTKGAVVAESTSMTSGSAVTYGQSDLDFYKVTSHIATVSNELLQDAAFDVQSHVIDILTKRLYRGLNYYYTQGTSGSHPVGIDSLSTKGVDALAQSITRANLNSLVYSVDRAYRYKAAFQMSDATIGTIRALYVGSTDATPLWTDTMREGEPNRLEGYPVYANPDVDDIRARKNSVFFGDWSRYFIGEALPLKLVRLAEYYAPSDQVGFAVLGRWAGNLIAYSGDAPIKHIRNANT